MIFESGRNDSQNSGRNDSRNGRRNDTGRTEKRMKRPVTSCCGVSQYLILFNGGVLFH